MMQHAADAFTIAAVLAGLWAALLWWRASEGELDLGPPGSSGDDNELALTDRFVNGLVNEWAKGSLLNSRAAKWTAASIALQATATVLGRLAVLG